jgi:hypothetical protein
MKKLFLLFVIGAVLVSCNSKKKEIERLQAKNDSLTALTQLKDESLLDFITSFNKVQENLDSIKAVENLITVNTSAGGEIKQDAKDQIMNDINAIHDLLVKNKKLVNSLRNKLNKSDKKIAALEKMISFLNQQLETKDAELAVLRDDLAKVNIKVDQLTVKVEELEDENTAKAQDIENKAKVIESTTSELNTAYYAIGTKKELIANNVISKEGGFIGIGSNKTLKKDFNKDYFTKIDITKLNFIPLMAKKANIVTTHPSDAYRISGVKKADTLYIQNTKSFWGASKYLVVIVE